MKVHLLWNHLREITNMKKLLIYGAGGNGKVCADIAKKSGYENIVFYDDNKNINSLDEYEVIHSLDNISEDEYDFFNAIGDNKTRELLTNKLNKNMATLIHPTAVIGENVTIDEGSVIMAKAVINPGCKIGKGVIINTCSSLDHDDVINDFSHISINSHLAGTVVLGKRVFVGMSSTIINNVDICDDVIIGAGATVVDSIEKVGTYVGVPAKLIK